MDTINLKNNPFALVQNVQITYSQIRGIAEANDDIVIINQDYDGKIAIRDLDISSNFLFEIYNPRFDNNKIFYTIKFNPSNHTILKARILEIESDKQRIIPIFKTWLQSIRNFNAAELHPGNNVLKEYQKQIYDTYKFLPDENDNKPLNQINQEQISKVIKLLIEEFKDDDEVSNNFIEELKLLNRLIPQLTQAQIKNQLSHKIAYLRFLGINAINRIIKVCTDAGIQLLFYRGLQLLSGGEFLTYIK